VKASKSSKVAPWIILWIGASLVPARAYLAAQTRQRVPIVEQATRTVFDLQRAYDSARMRRQPVTQLLADGFVEIQADGRVLTRSQAIEKYTRFDDVSTASLTERWTASYGDVVIIAGRGGEEGTPYSGRRLYVWASEGGSWRLLVFQETFVRSRTAKFSPVASEWPAEYQNEQPPLSEEGTFATRDSALIPRLLADDSILVDGDGEQFTRRTWLERLKETRESPVNVRGFGLLHQGDAIVVIGNELAGPTGIASRFTHVWRRSSRSTELLISQSTLAAAELFVPGRQRLQCDWHVPGDGLVQARGRFCRPCAEHGARIQISAARHFVRSDSYGRRLHRKLV
jgi:hypothetical protein